MDGYIKIYRSLFDEDSWLWKDKPFSKGQAWIDLLQLANIADSRALIKGKVVTIKRGQVFRALGTLADRWGWTRKKVRTFLALLENEKMVTTEGTTEGTLITIEKYTTYNALGHERDTTEGTTEGQPRANRGPSNKKNKKNKKNKYIGAQPHYKEFEKEDHTGKGYVTLTEEQKQELKDKLNNAF